MSDGSDTRYQVKEGLKSMARVAVATAINPAAGAAMLLFETGRSAAIALGGREAGQAVGSAIGIARGAASVDDYCDDRD